MLLLRSATKILQCNVNKNEQIRNIKRWVAPTLRELRSRSRKLKPQPAEPRSGFVDWNYRAELFAFGKRLHEEFQIPLLQTAFTQNSYIVKEAMHQNELGIEQNDAEKSICNKELAERGHYIANEYVEAFLCHSLPKLPKAGYKAIKASLLSVDTLANVALHLGMKELLLDSEYPPSQESMARSLLAVVGCLEQSSGLTKAFLFVRDFICTQLNQRDLLDLWPIENPEELLANICQERNMLPPEPRLISDCGKHTVLAAYFIGLYSNKQLLGKGFGEDIATAIKTASLDALQTIFDIHDNRKPFDFDIQVEPKSLKLDKSVNQISVL